MDNADAMQFTVHPTCPPSVGLYVRGGRMALPPSMGACMFYVNDGHVDLQTHNQNYWPYTFANPYWYLPLYVTITWYYTAWGDPYVNVSDPDVILLHGSIPGPGFGYSGGGYEEFETAAEAEDAIDAQRDDVFQDYICELGEPVARLVLRNNGNVMLPSQFQPVDPINRGRSYIWGLFRDGRFKA